MNTNQAKKLSVNESIDQTNLVNLLISQDYTKLNNLRATFVNHSMRTDVTADEKARSKARIELVDLIQDRSLELTAQLLGVEYTPLNNVPVSNSNTARQEQTFLSSNEGQTVTTTETKETEVSMATNVKEGKSIDINKNKQKEKPLVDAMTDIIAEGEKEKAKVSKQVEVISFERIPVLGTDVEKNIPNIGELKSIKNIVAIETKLRTLRKTVEINVLRNLYIDLIAEISEISEKLKADINLQAVRFKGTVELYKERESPIKKKDIIRVTEAQMKEEALILAKTRNSNEAYDYCNINARKISLINEDKKVCGQWPEAFLIKWFQDNIDSTFVPEKKEIITKQADVKELTDIKSNQDGENPFNEQLLTFKQIQLKITEMLDANKIAEAREFCMNVFTKTGWYKNDLKEKVDTLWSEESATNYFNSILKDHQKGNLNISDLSKEEQEIITKQAAEVMKNADKKLSLLEVFRKWSDTLDYVINTSLKMKIFKDAKAIAETVDTKAEVFVRKSIKEDYPSIWKSVENIVSLENLHKVASHLNKTQGYNVTLNAVYDIIETKNVISTENWTSVQIDDWFNKYILSGIELPKTEEPIKEENTTEIHTVEESNEAKGKHKKILIAECAATIAAEPDKAKRKELEKAALKQVQEFCESKKLNTQVVDGIMHTIRKKVAQQLKK